MKCRDQSDSSLSEKDGAKLLNMTGVWMSGAACLFPGILIPFFVYKLTWTPHDPETTRMMLSARVKIEQPKSRFSVWSRQPSE